MSDFKNTQIFSTCFRKLLKYKNFMKVHAVGADLFCADGQTDMTKRIAAFFRFANRPKNEHMAPPPLLPLLLSLLLPPPP